MDSESEAGPSPARKKEVGPFGPAQDEGSGGIFGPLRYDAGDIGDLSDRNDSKSGGPPATNCDVVVRRGELAVLKGAGADVVYEMAVRCFLDLGRPAVLVDGGCQADPYEVAAIAKRIGREAAGENGDAKAVAGGNGACKRARRVDEDEVLRNIHVARAFTAHQLEALIVQRLEPMLVRHRPMFVGVLSIDMLFRDEELDRYEAKIMQARCLRALRRLAKEHNVMAVATERGGRTVRHMNWY